MKKAPSRQADRFLEFTCTRDLYDIFNFTAPAYSSLFSSTVTIRGCNNGPPTEQVYNCVTYYQTLDTDKKRVWVTVTWKDQKASNSITVETIVVRP